MRRERERERVSWFVCNQPDHAVNQLTPSRETPSTPSFSLMLPCLISCSCDAAKYSQYSWQTSSRLASEAAFYSATRPVSWCFCTGDVSQQFSISPSLSLLSLLPLSAVFTLCSAAVILSPSPPASASALHHRLADSPARQLAADRQLHLAPAERANGKWAAVVLR
jgi:hypothetical protein